MIAVIKQNEAGEITGWMLGTDTDDIRRRAQCTMDHGIAQMFYNLSPFLAPGKTLLAPGVTMLVE